MGGGKGRGMNGGKAGTPGREPAPCGARFNSGAGFTLQPVDIGHARYVGLVDPDTAFWALAEKNRVGEILSGGSLLRRYARRRGEFLREMEALRFGQRPLAVYFNPTERCNLNCRYCYIPEAIRRRGVGMPPGRLLQALEILKSFFRRTLPGGTKPQIVFHGSEPMLAREAVFAGIERFSADFRFGIQTNGTLLDGPALEFITSRGIGLGLSLDGPTRAVADRARIMWDGRGVFDPVRKVIEKLRGYPGYSVLCTVTRGNVRVLPEIIEFLHALDVPVCMLNPVRCTMPGARGIKPGDAVLARYFLRALDRAAELYGKTGRKLVVANFANVLVGILAPTARRLMCDISPCGGGRCFFAVSARGDLFPCSEFIGLERFVGGNLFRGEIETALKSPAFRLVTGRKAEDIEPCRRCALRHFCGAPCPAEAHEMNGGLQKRGAFCELYGEQVRYALRAIADDRMDAYLWDDWDRGTRVCFEAAR